jgi:hypothetical protein
MEYYNDILCITHSELVNGLMTGSQYVWYYRNNTIRPVRRGCRGTPALYSVDSLPLKFKIEVYKKVKPENGESADVLLSLIRTDEEAARFFMNYRLSDGSELKPERRSEYINAACILNAENVYLQRHMAARSKSGRGSLPKKVLAEKLAAALPGLCEKGWAHKLPENPRKLMEKLKRYNSEGYASLVKKTSETAKTVAIVVTPVIERMLLSIYVMKNKPFVEWVCDIYQQFLAGQIEMYDKTTGELFNREDFYKDGEPITLSKSTVWNWINKPKNRRLVDSLRNDMKYNRRVHDPYERRKSPDYSLSKISLDDRDLTRKTTDGETVHAYYAYDVASGCCVAAAYSLNKKMPLVWECLGELYRYLTSNNLGNPLECEVEHHLTGNITDILNELFPYVRLCNPANSQEKRAEHGNKYKKYHAEKRLGQPTGRFYSKHEAYLMPQTMGKDNVILEKKVPYAKLIEEDREAIAMHNNEAHPDTKKYSGMTRMDVLLQMQNPNLPAIDNKTWIKHVGKTTKTTVRNTKYCRVQYADYCLPAPEVIDRLKPGNYECDAYYLAKDDGTIDSIYLYQGGRFIAECKKVVPYQESAAERTEADEAAMLEQHKYNAKYYRMLREGKEEKIAKVEILKTAQVKEIEQIEVVKTAPPVRDEIDAIIAEVYASDYSEFDVKKHAIDTM